MQTLKTLLNKVNRITPIHLEWNSYNGFIFTLLHVDFISKREIDGSLIGINFSTDFFYIDLFFKNIKLFDKSESTNSSDLDSL